MNMNTNINYSMPVRFLKATIGFGNTDIIIIKETIHQFFSEYYTNMLLGPEIRLDMNPTDKVNISLGSQLFDYNNTKYSLQSAMNNNYLSQEYNTSVDWQLPNSFFLSTEFTYTINSQRAAGFNSKIPIWNASISKQFLKYNRGELKLIATDLLNQ